MIFITIGSRNFQFNRLLKAADEAIENKLITDEVFAQSGSSDYQIKNFCYTEFLNHDEYTSQIEKCDIVITHGGTGAIINSVKLGKRVIAVPRLAMYDEAVDDHQLQLVRAFEKNDIVTPCYECTAENLAEAIILAKHCKVKKYSSNTKNLIDSINEFIINI